MAERIPNFDRSTAKKIEAPDLSEIKEFLSREIIGQPEAAEFWAQTLHRILSKSPKLRNGPEAVVIEIGPSGVGKTEIVKKVAQYLVGKEGEPKFIRVDCGEFQQEHEVAKILGAPPGYRGGEITSRLAQSEISKEAITLKDGRSITVLLFDEIEKANPKLSVALLGALDYGKLTMGDNSIVDLTNTIVVFTSNLGNQEIKTAEQQGVPLDAQGKLKARMNAMGKHFTPEQLSRMGGESGTVIFQELSREVMADILLEKLNKLEKKYLQQGKKVKFAISTNGMNALLDLGHSTTEGARRIEHVIEQQVIAKLSGIGEQINGMTVMIDAEENGVVLYGSGENSSQVIQLGEASSTSAKVEKTDTGSSPRKRTEEERKIIDPTLLEYIEMQKYPFMIYRIYKDYLARLGALIYASEVRWDDEWNQSGLLDGSPLTRPNEILEKTRKGELPDDFFFKLYSAIHDRQKGTTRKSAHQTLEAIFKKMAEISVAGIKEKDKQKTEKTKHIESLLAGALQEHPEALITFFRDTFKSDLKKYEVW